MRCIVHQDVEIVPERLGELRLRVHQIHDAQVGREAADMLVEGGARDAALLRERPQAFEALLEIRRRLRGSRSPASADGRTSRTRRSIRAAATARARWPRPAAARARPVRGRGTGRLPTGSGGCGGRPGRRESGRAEHERSGERHQANRRECFGIVRSQPSLMSRQDHVRRLAQSLAVHWGKIWLSEG